MKWNDVTKKQPVSGQKVLCFVNDIVNSWQTVLQFYVCPEYLTHQWDDLDGEEFPCIVTHWAELPEPPK